MGYHEVWNEVLSWPVEEQARLAAELQNRLGDPRREPELSEEFKRELDRRIAELDANPESAIPWEIVEAEINERFGL